MTASDPLVGFRSDLVAGIERTQVARKRRRVTAGVVFAATIVVAGLAVVGLRPDPVDNTTVAADQPAAGVSIDVFNAGGLPGLATSASTVLRAAGYAPRNIGDADQFGLTESRIEHGRSAGHVATDLSAVLDIGRVVERRELAADEVRVLLGTDFGP